MSGPALTALAVEEPTLRQGLTTPRGWSAYAAIAIDAAVNLTEDRRYRDVPINERLATAVGAQRGFLGGLLDPQLGAVLDLRIVHDPQRRELSTAIVLRALGGDEQGARARARGLANSVLASVPDHVVASLVEDRARLDTLLVPFGGEIADAAFLAREEIARAPVRRDIRRRYSYLYSVAPMHVAAVDWAPLYRQLLDCPDPVVLSVAIQPRRTPEELAALLGQYATLYGQWARPERSQADIYAAEQSLPAEAFAVEAQAVFADYAQRLSQRCFAIRAMLASPAQLPVGLAQTFAGVIFPAAGRDERALDVRRAPTGSRIRTEQSGAQLARWNLQMVDLGVPPGDPQIWQQPAPPPATLADLPILGDASDASCAFRLPIALTGDLPGVPVRRRRSGSPEAARGGRRPIRLGVLDDKGTELSIDANSLSRHGLIAGGTGSGKTTLVLEILRQLWSPLDHERRRIPFLVIEPANDRADDYRKLLHLPEFAEDLEIYTVGDERTRPLRFNPFAVPAGVLVAEHSSALLTAFKAAFGLWDPLPAIYEEAIAEAYASCGILPSETGGGERRWPTAIAFVQAMQRTTTDLGYSGEVKANLEAASVVRARQLAYGPCASTFRTDGALDLDHLLSRPVVIELKTLGSGEEQALVIGLLLGAIAEHYKVNRGAQAELQHVTVIEEAHRLMARARGSTSGSPQGQAKEHAAEAFASVLAENRKYGEGVLIAEQVPSKLVEDAVKNTNLKIMCRLTSAEERDYLGLSMALSPEQRSAAARLAVGEALVYSDELANPVEVRTQPTLHDAAGEDLEVPDSIPVARSAPFALCEICPEPCSWRPVGLTLSRRPAILAASETWQGAVADAASESPNDAARSLVGAIVGEVQRYPSISPQDGRAPAAICTLVHSLDGRTDRVSWLSWCKERILEATAVLAD